jgi:hypothetical protein
MIVKIQLKFCKFVMFFGGLLGLLMGFNLFFGNQSKFDKKIKISVKFLNFYLKHQKLPPSPIHWATFLLLGLTLFPNKQIVLKVKSMVLIKIFQEEKGSPKK